MDEAKSIADGNKDQSLFNDQTNKDDQKKADEVKQANQEQEKKAQDKVAKEEEANIDKLAKEYKDNPEGEHDPNATPPNKVDHPSGGIPLEGDWPRPSDPPAN